MFTVNTNGVPALKMVPLSDIYSNKFYLSSDHSAVVFRDGNEATVIYDLNEHNIMVYGDDCGNFEITENHPSCAILFPSDVVKVSMVFNIQGAEYNE